MSDSDGFFNPTPEETLRAALIAVGTLFFLICVAIAMAKCKKRSEERKAQRENDGGPLTIENT